MTTDREALGGNRRLARLGFYWNYRFLSYFRLSENTCLRKLKTDLDAETP